MREHKSLVFRNASGTDVIVGVIIVQRRVWGAAHRILTERTRVVSRHPSHHIEH